MNDFIKICPKCGCHNPEGENICRHCAHFLGLVRPISHAEADHMKADAGPPPEPMAGDGGEDIQELEEIDLIPESGPDHLVLESLTNGRSYVVKSGGIIGRADETSQADVQLSDLPGLNFISREHCRFFFQDGYWYVTVLRSAMNGLSVNQVELGPGERAVVEPGDTVVLANAPFRVKPDHADGHAS